MSARFSWWPFGRDVLLGVALIGSLSALTALAAQPPVPAVIVCQPVEREVTDHADFTGQLTAVQTVEIRPRISGLLQKVHVQGGALVKKGELLFEIDPAAYQAALARAEVALVRSEARQEQAKRDLNRARALLRNKAASQEDLDKAGQNYEEEVAASRLAKLNVQRAQVDLEATRVRAPIDGKIGLPRVSAGNEVNGAGAGATVLATVVRVDVMGVAFDVDEKTFLGTLRKARGEKVKAGPTPLAIALADEKGFPHEGLLEAVDNRVDPKTGTIRMRGVLSNPKGFLVPGLFARVRMIFGAPYRALLVHEGAVLSSGNSPDTFVNVVNDKNRVERRKVKLGSRQDEMRVVESGLRADEWVVVTGDRDLRPGDTVKPRREGAPAPKRLPGK